MRSENVGSLWLNIEQFFCVCVWLSMDPSRYISAASRLLNVFSLSSSSLLLLSSSFLSVNIPAAAVAAPAVVT